eukprot:354992-Chlamydomonas_euryale.AAC.1
MCLCGGGIDGCLVEAVWVCRVVWPVFVGVVHTRRPARVCVGGAHPTPGTCLCGRCAPDARHVFVWEVHTRRPARVCGGGAHPTPGTCLCGRCTPDARHVFVWEVHTRRPARVCVGGAHPTPGTCLCGWKVVVEECRHARMHACIGVRHAGMHVRMHHEGEACRHACLHACMSTRHQRTDASLNTCNGARVQACRGDGAHKDIHA